MAEGRVLRVVDWDRYPFKMIDSLGVGHDDKSCPALVERGKCRDALMARDAWPCGQCVDDTGPQALALVRDLVLAPLPTSKRVEAVRAARTALEAVKAAFGE